MKKEVKEKTELNYNKVKKIMKLRKTTYVLSLVINQSNVFLN